MCVLCGLPDTGGHHMCSNNIAWEGLLTQCRVSYAAAGQLLH
jgi:hypothetical protein